MFPAAVIIVACFALVALFLFKYATSTYTYWKKKSVPFATPVPFFGNIKDHVTLKMTQGECLRNIYNDFPQEKFVGMYQLQTPTLLLRDPEVIRMFLVKSFAHFTDRGFSYDAHREPLTKHLVNLEGDAWKMLRQKLSPTFSSGKIKNMMGLLQGCGVQLLDYMQTAIESGQTEFEMRDLTAKFTTDVIGTCAFGLECNSLKDSQSEFRRMGCAVLNSSASMALAKIVRVFFPRLFKAFKLRTFPFEVQQFFMGIVKQTIDFRNTNQIRRNDFIQLLLEIKNQKHDGNASDTIELTEELIAAQVFVFFLAGFETSSTTLSFCLHEMAINQDVQSRVHGEIVETADKYGLPFSYEAVSSMNYLEQCIKETMRKYPPVQALVRVCTKPFRMPGSDVDLDVGTAVLIPVYALHHDPQYYPDPDAFDPGRFAKNEATGGGDNGTRPAGTYLPFGDGPRICIGMRFAMLEMKLALAQFLHDYAVTLSDKSNARIEFEPASFLSCPKGGIWLNVHKR